MDVLSKETYDFVNEKAQLIDFAKLFGKINGLQYQLAIFRAFWWPTELISRAVDSGDQNLHSLFKCIIFFSTLNFNSIIIIA